MSAAIASATVTSVAPAERVHTVHIETLAVAMGMKIANRSMGTSIEDVVDSTFAQHSIFDADIAGVSAAIDGEIALNTELSSDMNKAINAVDTVLEELFGTMIEVTGWVSGEQMLIRGEIFELTGRACVNCGVNPEANARAFRGVRCANVAECGHESRF